MKKSYFTLDEFECPCCGQAHMSAELLAKLDLARKLAGVPFYLHSAYRCPAHNQKIGGKPDSAHTKGMAVDIRAANSRHRYKILAGLLEAGFHRIGIGQTFIHADTDLSRDKEVVWLY